MMKKRCELSCNKGGDRDRRERVARKAKTRVWEKNNGEDSSKKKIWCFKLKKKSYQSEL